MPYGLDLAKASGAQAAGNFINEGMGLLMQPLKNKQQLKQARRLQDLSLEGEATRLQRNQAYALDMWEKTGYGAQVDQMKRAGINPALLYGMSGGGGQTSNVPTAATTGQQADTATASHGSEGMGMSLAAMSLIPAQKKVLETQADKNQAEADKTRGVDTDLGNTQIENLRQGITNQKTANELMQIQDSLLRNELFEKYKTQEWRFQAAGAEADIKLANAKSAMVQANIDEQTQESKIEILAQQAIGSALVNSLTTAQTAKAISDINVNNATIQKYAAEIAQNWYKLTQTDREIMMKGIQTHFNITHPGMSQQIGNFIEEIKGFLKNPPVNALKDAIKASQK